MSINNDLWVSFKTKLTPECVEYQDTDTILKDLVNLKNSIDRNVLKSEYKKIIEWLKWKTYKSWDVLEVLFFDKKITFQLSNWVLKMDNKSYKIADSFSSLSFLEEWISFSWSDNICLTSQEWDIFSTLSNFNYNISYNQLLEEILTNF